MIPRAQPLLAPDKRSDKRTFQKEREHAFHRERLSNHAARISREARPVRPELKLHGDTSHNAHGEVEAENFGPKPNGLIILFITRSESAPFPIDQEPRQSHGELRKEVVIGEREGELEPAPESRIVAHRDAISRISQIQTSRFKATSQRFSS